MKISSKLKELISKTEDVLYPHYSCPFCETETIDGTVCDSCKQYFILPNFCNKCSEHVGGDATLCIQCKDTDRIFDQSFSVVHYTEKVSASVHKLKFGGGKYLALDFAKLLAEKFKTLNLSIDIVTYVPSHAKRIKERGYNQAKEIAENFCKIVDLPCAKLLDKTKDTAHQTELTKAERLKNLENSFAITDKWLVKNKSILVIDDVFTTGSTMSACAKVLKKAKANKVYGLTLAKTKLNINR